MWQSQVSRPCHSIVMELHIEGVRYHFDVFTQAGRCLRVGRWILRRPASSLEQPTECDRFMSGTGEELSVNRQSPWPRCDETITAVVYKALTNMATERFPISAPFQFLSKAIQNYFKLHVHLCRGGWRISSNDGGVVYIYEQTTICSICGPYRLVC